MYINVLWNDESCFTIWQPDRRHWVRWMPSERFGGASVMVWGYFSWFDLDPLVSEVGNMNTEMYEDILDNVLSTLWQYFEESSYFRQDNCSIHVSRLTQSWFNEMDVQKLDYPSQSPDLNLIGLRMFRT